MCWLYFRVEVQVFIVKLRRCRFLNEEGIQLIAALRIFPRELGDRLLAA